MFDTFSVNIQRLPCATHSLIRIRISQVWLPWLTTATVMADRTVAGGMDNERWWRAAGSQTVAMASWCRCVKLRVRWCFPVAAHGGLKVVVLVSNAFYNGGALENGVSTVASWISRRNGVDAVVALLVLQIRRLLVDFFGGSVIISTGFTSSDGVAQTVCEDGNAFAFCVATAVVVSSKVRG